MKWYYYLGYPWMLPHFLIGLLLAPFYKTSQWRWNDGCLEALAGRMIGNPGAQTHGFLIYYRDTQARGDRVGYSRSFYENPKLYDSWQRKRKRLRVHERVHVAQGALLGPIFMISYVLFFLGKWASQGFKGWYRAYRWNPYERQAYRIEEEFVRGKRDGAWGDYNTV